MLSGLPPASCHSCSARGLQGGDRRPPSPCAVEEGSQLATRQAVGHPTRSHSTSHAALYSSGTGCPQRARDLLCSDVLVSGVPAGLPGLVGSCRQGGTPCRGALCVQADPPELTPSRPLHTHAFGLTTPGPHSRHRGAARHPQNRSVRPGLTRSPCPTRPGPDIAKAASGSLRSAS